MIVKINLKTPVRIIPYINVRKEDQIKVREYIDLDGSLLFVCTEAFVESNDEIYILDSKYLVIDDLSFIEEFRNKFHSDFDILNQLYVISPERLLNFTTQFLEKNGIKVILHDKEEVDGVSS